jgi:hypothetical protein
MLYVTLFLSLSIVVRTIYVSCVNINLITISIVITSLAYSIVPCFGENFEGFQ